MHAAKSIVSQKYGMIRPYLSRAFAAVVSAALTALLLLGVPVSAGAAMSNNGGSLSPLRLDPAPSAPKVVATAAAANALPQRAVLRKQVRAPKAPAARSSRSARVSRGASGSGWRSARVSWYGPGFYGHTMAGGGTLQRDSMVVAHRSLPFGTRIMFSYRGRSTTAVVRDRGPYAGGRVFDLGPGTAKALGFSGVGTVRYRILGR